ncbi:unnamed protein product [Danaus chrysippus]|uniref:Exocyst complex component Sec8 n=1 Tax=Danaus chrysippus TaxID=151541 RepID=A0A8J2QFB9_9NEOP|nr:unnamed protein product [Danaus chrysippus]
MSSPPPTKPPRGVKQGKETSGLLMSVIRTLSASETNEQREKERAKLEKEYKKSDARLDELVAAHAQEITDVMQKFSLVSTALSSWGQHCSAAEARLAACRALLRVRRDDLRRLWADARTHHHALRMLTDIERVVVCEREARELTAAGRVVGAAHALRAALMTARTELPAVTALSTTTDHLEAKKQELVDVIVSRLSDAVYRDERAPLNRRLSARRRTALLLAELTKSEEVTDSFLQDITPEYEASLADEDRTFENNVMICMEALGVLEQLKEATEKFKVQIQNELLEVIDSVSRRIIEEGDVEEGEEDGEIQEAGGESETGRPLTRLIHCLTEEFEAGGTRNRRSRLAARGTDGKEEGAGRKIREAGGESESKWGLLLQLWRAALTKHKISDQTLHTEQHYWSAVQQVMQLLLTEYLEIESVALSSQRPPEPVAELKLSDYFSKKKPQRRRDKLFKLMTSPPPSVRGRRHRYPLVCTPQPALLHAALPALHALCALIEKPGAGECSLRMFVSDYVRWCETERLSREARAAVEAAVKAPGAWRERVMVSGRESDRPVLSCCVEAWSGIYSCALHARRCGSCGGVWAARASRPALSALAQHARLAHSTLQPPPPARAARWLADDDIVRFLTALPNYMAVVQRQDYTDKELKQAYEREAEILGSSLGDGEVSGREITHKIDTLVELALLSESMEWLSQKIKTLPSIMSASSPSAPGIKLSEKFINEIQATAAVFEDIAQKCLLFLHLEVRIECFHYLGQEEREEVAGPGDGEEAGGAGGAARLAHRLLALHEHAANILTPAAMTYIMNGIGEMMSAAVVWRWQSSAAVEGARGAEGARGVVGAGAVSRLAALRHCLAALSVPHDGLHAAHAYMHLLACTPEEIITSVREKGPQFSELEYLNAFKVIGARRGLSSTDMKEQLKQLSAALGHVGVTV